MDKHKLTYKELNDIQYEGDPNYYKIILCYSEEGLFSLEDQYWIINTQTNEVVLQVLFRNSRIYGIEIVDKKFNKKNDTSNVSFIHSKYHPNTHYNSNVLVHNKYLDNQYQNQIFQMVLME